jgi:serine/threonine-protein kinase
MGQVWVARLVGARGFQKFVAIKTLLPELRDDKRIEDMLLEEARIASLIHHPNVVQTTELGEHHGYLYLVMEWVDGESLSFVMRRAEERGWIPLPVGVQLVAQACRGLHAAHELTSDLGVHLGVVHRDVSPHNVLVTHGGVVKLVDFGIAKAMNEQGSLTANGELKGKYSFMAPEQVLTNEVDRRADIFTLGITLYMLLTRRHPFKVNTNASVLGAITSDAPPTKPSHFLPSCPHALEAVVMRALDKDPEQRFPTADALRVALEHAVPEAFAPGFEAEVTTFLGRTMGDRAQARREALRRFQLTADERVPAVDVGTPALPSQSAGSFRAIVVDTPPGMPRTDGTGSMVRVSDAPTQIGRRQRGRRIAVALVALVALLLAAALLVQRVSPDPTTAGEPAAEAPAVASPVPRETLPPAPAAATARSDATSAERAVPAKPALAASESRPQASSRTQGMRPSRAAPKGATTAAPREKKKPPKADAANDLIAPDYAQ